MSRQKTKIVIDRAKWRTGAKNPNVATGLGDTLLLNDQGYMCCLGFICKAAGVPDDRLKTGEPGDLYVFGDEPELISVPDISDIDDEGSYYQTHYADAAIEINDNENTPLEQKEASLRRLFAPSCYELEFVGEPILYPANDD